MIVPSLEGVAPFLRRTVARLGYNADR
jgi:hypothetical protein